MKILCFRYPRNAVTDILVSVIIIFVIMLILNNAEYNREKLCYIEQDVIEVFIESNGWMADLSRCSYSEKLIPEVFDETYNDYALLQRAQGFDINRYKGKRVVLCSCPLLNYPGYENNENIFIDILLFDGSIIGADICCTSIDGFITGAVTDGNYQT